MKPTTPNLPKRSDPFEALRPAARCLSGWQVSRAALGELAPAAMDAVKAHTASCAACRARWVAERAAVDAARDEPLPDALRQHPAMGVAVEAANTDVRGPDIIAAPRFARGRVVAMLGVLAAAALVFMVVRPPASTDSGAPDTPTERAKGNIDVHVAIQRAGLLVADNVPAASAGPLALGDEIRLRVGRQAGAHIVVAGLEGGAWVELFRGLAPSDGWLPVGLVVTPGDPPRLRILACQHMPEADIAVAPVTPHDCTRLEYGFVLQ